MKWVHFLLVAGLTWLVGLFYLHISEIPVLPELWFAPVALIIFWFVLYYYATKSKPEEQKRVFRA